MKKIILAILSFCLVFSASAQTTNAITPAISFFGTVQSYLTSFNPEYSFDGNKVEVSIGADYAKGQSWADYITAQYNLGKWDVQANFRNLGIGGDLQSVQVGGGYALFQKFDTKVEGYIVGGYSFAREVGIIEPGIVVRKKATANTFYELGLSWPIYTSGAQATAPNIRIGTGFTF